MVDIWARIVLLHPGLGGMVLAFGIDCSWARRPYRLDTLLHLAYNSEYDSLYLNASSDPLPKKDAEQSSCYDHNGVQSLFPIPTTSPLFKPSPSSSALLNLPLIFPDSTSDLIFTLLFRLCFPCCAFS